MKERKERLKWFSKFFKKGTGEADPQFQVYRDEVHEIAFKRAFELLRISESDVTKEQPIILLAPEQLDKRSKVRYKVVLEDEQTADLLYDQALITMLLFGEDSLFFYQANLDYRYGFVTNDVVSEVNYLDIMSYQTSFEYDDIEDPLFEIVDLDLFLYDGRVVHFNLRFRLFNGTEEELVLNETEKLVLDKFHTIVREKKRTFLE